MSRVRHEQQQEQPLPGDHQAVPALERGGLGEARRGSVEAADAAAEVGHGSRVWGGRRGGAVRGGYKADGLLHLCLAAPC